MEPVEKSIDTEITKVDEELGLVLGFAIICKENGEDYIDVQGDHVPEASMLKAATDFMQNSRKAYQMHSKEKIEVGDVVFSFPLTTDIAKAFSLETKKTGWLYAVKPFTQELMNKYKTGEYTGFSIGGYIKVSETIDA